MPAIQGSPSNSRGLHVRCPGVISEGEAIESTRPWYLCHTALKTTKTGGKPWSLHQVSSVSPQGEANQNARPRPPCQVALSTTETGVKPLALGLVSNGALSLDGAVKSKKP